jgi:hypothetical protein
VISRKRVSKIAIFEALVLSFVLIGVSFTLAVSKPSRAQTPTEDELTAAYNRIVSQVGRFKSDGIPIVDVLIDRQLDCLVVTLTTAKKDYVKPIREAGGYDMPIQICQLVRPTAYIDGVAPSLTDLVSAYHALAVTEPDLHERLGIVSVSMIRDRGILDITVWDISNETVQAIEGIIRGKAGAVVKAYP